MDLLSVLPGFQTRSYAHIIPPLERNKITIVDLITLDNLEIAKRAHVPPADLRRLTTQVVKALHKDVGFEEACDGDDAVEPSSSNDIEKPLIPGPSTKLDLSRWSAISTLDPALDELLNGGLATGYLTEVTGESGSGKTQFLLSLLLAVQLSEPRGLGKGAIYISTEAPLATSRLSQLLEYHPYLSTLPKDRAPTLENILSINAMDLESQDHILNYQLPVAITRYDVGLVVIDSITSNYRAEHTSHNVLGLSTRSGELARLGQLLRNLAVAKNIAIVVANQVSDRFDPLESNAALRRAAAYGNTIISSPPVSTQQQPTTPLHRDSGGASPLPAARSRPPESGNAELSPHITIAPPSSSPAFPSSPFVGDENQSEQQQQDFDGSYLIGNPVRNELLSLVHQQRFFTGWGDTLQAAAPPSPYYFSRQPTHKTPALGFVWSSQIACRIALKKEEIAILLDPAFEPKSTDPLSPASQPHEGIKPTSDGKEQRSDHHVVETNSVVPPVRPRATPQPAAPDTVPPRTLRRTMKLVFAPWTSGRATATVDKEGNPTVYIQDEVEYTIWKGGLRSVEAQE
ncbi:DNA repair protein rhp57 [Aspergillus lentulus]|uniref:DNA repair protein rhp57 n=1 Tax=Aspergillus lentulus TaxID=293939 RepID=A0AAN4TDT5_ASPLE|nr:DNA repair protein rhp57 [Aspergillus lentulus]